MKLSEFTAVGERIKSSANNPTVRFILPIIFIHQILSSLAYPVAKLGLNQIDPFVYAFYRFAICSVIYSLILLFRKNSVKIEKRDQVRIFIVGLLLIPMNQLLFLVGQSMTTAGHGSLLFATTPIFIYILAVFFLGERPTFRRTIGILIAAAGVYIVVSGGKVRFGSENLFGDLVILAAVISWAFGTIAGIPMAQKYGAFRATGLAMVYGSGVYFPYGLYRVLKGNPEAVGWQTWISIFYMAVLISVVAYVLWYWVLKYMEASRVAIIQNIQPIIAAGVAAALLSEPITGHLILGGLVVIGGVVLTELK